MFVIIRELNDNESIFGSLFFNGAFICFTLENAKKAIQGNTWKDSAGCVLVGMGADYAKHRLVSSAEAEGMVVSLAKNNVQLVITEI